MGRAVERSTWSLALTPAPPEDTLYSGLNGGVVQSSNACIAPSGSSPAQAFGSSPPRPDARPDRALLVTHASANSVSRMREARAACRLIETRRVSLCVLATRNRNAPGSAVAISPSSTAHGRQALWDGLDRTAPDAVGAVIANCQAYGRASCASVPVSNGSAVTAIEPENGYCRITAVSSPALTTTAMVATIARSTRQ